jgi:DNA-directed RNA polymerase II subunit RPB11
MNIKIIEEKEDSLEFILRGETHTFANMLRKALLKNPHVLKAAYNIPHPLTDKEKPRLYVQTDGKVPPSRAVAEAAKCLEENLDEVKKKLK